jgi:hypothetical protein
LKMIRVRGLHSFHVSGGGRSGPAHRSRIIVGLGQRCTAVGSWVEKPSILSSALSALFNATSRYLSFLRELVVERRGLQSCGERRAPAFVAEAVRATTSVRHPGMTGDTRISASQQRVRWAELARSRTAAQPEANDCSCQNLTFASAPENVAGWREADASITYRLRLGGALSRRPRFVNGRPETRLRSRKRLFLFHQFATRRQTEALSWQVRVVRVAPRSGCLHVRGGDRHRRTP